MTTSPFLSPPLRPEQIEDLRLATSKMTGAARRAFMAEMTLKYGGGSARLAETRFSWNRQARVEVLRCPAKALFKCESSMHHGQGTWKNGKPLAHSLQCLLASA